MAPSPHMIPRAGDPGPRAVLKPSFRIVCENALADREEQPWSKPSGARADMGWSITTAADAVATVSPRARAAGTASARSRRASRLRNACRPSGPRCRRRYGVVAAEFADALTRREVAGDIQEIS